MGVDLALLLPSFRGGGIERIRLNLAAAFRDRGVKVDLVAARAEGPFLSEVPDGVRIVDLGANRALRALPGLVRYLRRERPRALLSALDYTNVVALWARYFSGASTRIVIGTHKVFSIATLHSPLWRERHLLPWAMRVSYPFADGIVAVSDGIADDLAKVGRISRDRIVVIGNPALTPKVLELAERDVDHPWYSDPDLPVILSVGRLTQEKDFGTLITAFHRMREGVNARLVILGEGEERKALEELRDQLRLNDVVSLPGFNQNPYAHMRRARLFVSSSAWEGFGNVHVEALACGCPVVSTDAPTGPRDILQDGRYGRLVPVGNAAALAAAMIETLEHPPLPDYLRCRAMDFHIDRIVEQYRSLLCV